MRFAGRSGVAVRSVKRIGWSRSPVDWTSNRRYEHADARKRSPFQPTNETKSPDPFFRLYLTCRYIAGNVPLYFITIALGLFVVSPLISAGPNYSGALVLLSLLAGVSLIASIATGVILRRMVR